MIKLVSESTKIPSLILDATHPVDNMNVGEIHIRDNIRVLQIVNMVVFLSLGKVKGFLF